MAVTISVTDSADGGNAVATNGLLHDAVLASLAGV